MDEIDLLKRLEESFPDPDVERVERARLTVMRKIVTPPPVRTRLPRFRRRWVVATAVTAAAAGVALALPAILPTGVPQGPQKAVARALDRAAAVAARQPAELAPQLGQYVYTKSESVGTMIWIPGEGLENFFVTLRSTRESWIGPDGSGRILTAEEKPSFPTPEDRAAWEASGIDTGDFSGISGGRTQDETFQPGEMHYLDLAGLPTDPGELRDLIEARTIEGGPPGDWETFAIIGDLLRETYAPPGVRSALYRIAADLPGVELVGKVTDPLGREGVAVAYTHDGVRHELLFDPDTSRLLAEREVMIDPAAYGVDIASEPGTTGVAYARPGGVIYSSVYVDSGVVDSTHDVPQ